MRSYNKGYSIVKPVLLKTQTVITTDLVESSVMLLSTDSVKIAIKH